MTFPESSERGVKMDFELVGVCPGGKKHRACGRNGKGGGKEGKERLESASREGFQRGGQKWAADTKLNDRTACAPLPEETRPHSSAIFGKAAFHCLLQAAWAVEGWREGKKGKKPGRSAGQRRRTKETDKKESERHGEGGRGVHNRGQCGPYTGWRHRWAKSYSSINTRVPPVVVMSPWIRMECSARGEASKRGTTVGLMLSHYADEEEANHRGIFHRGGGGGGRWRKTWRIRADRWNRF